MQYIDAERLRAEIERRKKEHMNVDLQRQIGRYYEDRDILALLDSLQQEQPSLPDDLDEAAEEYMKKAKKHLFDDSPIGRADDAFKAGAEWMAEHLAGVRKMIEPEKKRL